MTEERKKYLASISKEERAIRDALDKEKLEFKDAKMELNFWGEDIHIGQVRKWVNLHKVVIKALKKQLPAPAKMSCPICKIVRTTTYLGFNEFEFDGEYCAYCGQKLR